MGFLEKLVEVFAQGCGAIARPWLHRRMEKAKTLAEIDRVKMLAAAKAEIESNRMLLLGPGDDAMLAELIDPGEAAVADAESMATRIEERRVYQEARRQANIERIALGAAEDAPPDEEVSPDPVEPDWVVRFFTAAQDISNEKLQVLWSRLLAREVTKPGTVSLRTLEVLRNLSHTEARMFDEVRQDFCTGGSQVFLPDVLSRPQLTTLQECGLLGTLVTWRTGSPEQVIAWQHARVVLLMASRDAVPLPWHVGGNVVTSAGVQLASTKPATLEPNLELLAALADQMEEHAIIEVVDGGAQMAIREFLAAQGKSQGVAAAVGASRTDRSRYR